MGKKKDDKKKNNGKIKIAGQTFKVGNKVGAGELRAIAAATNKSVSQVAQKASNKGVKTSSAAQNVVRKFSAPPPSPVPQPTPSPSYGGGGGGGGGFGDFGGSVFDYDAIPENFINEPIYNAAQNAANLQMQKQIEELRDAGQTERQKLINENNLAVTGAEIKGRLDLQGIINSGYKNIANIERGSNMFSSIMSAFNF
jgi:hypothetical protein